MNLSAPFIRRPVATTLLMAGLMLAGVLAFFRLPVAPLPSVEIPTIYVSARMAGASPETMATAVATPLERRLGMIADVTEMTSSSTQGRMSITLQFRMSRPIEAAYRDVQAAINASAADLPADLPGPPRAYKSNPANAPVMVLAVTSTTLPMSSVYDVADGLITSRLSQVEGVSQVDINGAERSAVRIEVDLRKAAAAGLSLEEIRQALAAANVSTPAGRIGTGARFWRIDAAGQLRDPADYRQLILRMSQGAPLTLGSIARVEAGPENTRLAGWYNGEPAVLLFIRKEAAANIIETVDGIRAILPQLMQWIPPGLEIHTVVDRTRTIRASVHEVERTLALSAVLVVLTVFLFLRRLSATAIPAATVPLSIAGTFAAMYAMGYSLDNVSLMALTVAVGFIIDDAIVVLENIVRHLERGVPPVEAALRGSREVGFTVVSITLSLIAVFIPILFMSGVVGRLFREFAGTLSVAVAISAVISLTLTPMMCSRLLKATPAAPTRPGWLERATSGMQRGYERSIGWFLRHSWLSLLVTLGCMAGAVHLYVELPKGLFPQQDTALLYGGLEAAPDVSFDVMMERQRAAARIVLQDPAVSGVVSYIGGGPGNRGWMTIALKPVEERTERIGQVMTRLRPRLAQIPATSIVLFPAQDFRSGGRQSRAEYQFTLLGDQIGELQAFALKLAERMESEPTVKDVNLDRSVGGLEARVTVDRDRARALNVSVAQIDSALYNAFGQRQAVTLYTDRDQRRVILAGAADQVRTPEALSNIRLTGSDGRQIPLDSLAKVTIANAPLSVQHQGLQPAITLSFNLAEGAALGAATAAIQRAMIELQAPETIRAEFAGTASTFRSAQLDQPLLILAALIAVYLVLGILYESLVHPLTIIATLPSAGLGALIALWYTGEQLSLIATIGIILLIGIVKKNSIMLVDFAISERRQGATPRDAILAACGARFRPIMMTTLAALLGAVPLAIGEGAGAELRRPLGITLIGGLLVSQAITMYATPVFYLAFERMAGWGRRRAPAPAV